MVQLYRLYLKQANALSKDYGCNMLTTKDPVVSRSINLDYLAEPRWVGDAHKAYQLQSQHAGGRVLVVRP